MVSNENIGSQGRRYRFALYPVPRRTITHRGGGEGRGQEEARPRAGAKAHVDWAGDTASLTDRLTGAKTKAYVMVVALPYSDRFWAQGFADMRQRSWQEGQARALEDFGGVPRMLVPDNAATATDRSSACVTLVNDEHRRFAEHCGRRSSPPGSAAPRQGGRRVHGRPRREVDHRPLRRDDILLARGVRRVLPRASAPAERPPVLREGGVARLRVRGRGARVHAALPSERCEMCEWRSCKVAPDHHVTVDYMRHPAPFHLIGEQVDVRLSDSA